MTRKCSLTHSILLFEDVWEIAFDPPMPMPVAPPKLLAKIKAAPRNTEFVRAQREVVCTPLETQQLLRIYTVAGSVYAVLGDRHRLRLASDAGRLIIDALRKAATR